MAELAAELGVSAATVRRDLVEMEQHDLLRRIHGGATLNGVSRLEPLFHDKQGLHAEAKRAIGAKALELIENGDTIYLDGGSTVLALVSSLDRKRDLTIVTNSLVAAAALINSKHRLILVGGEFRALSRTLIGSLTEPVISRLHVQKAFMGTIGITVDDGLTTTDPEEAFTKGLITRRAEQVILLADSSKFGRRVLAKSAGLGDVDILVTEEIGVDRREEIEAHDVRVLVAGKPQAPQQ